MGSSIDMLCIENNEVAAVLQEAADEHKDIALALGRVGATAAAKIDTLGGQ